MKATDAIVLQNLPLFLQAVSFKIKNMCNVTVKLKEYVVGF